MSKGIRYTEEFKRDAVSQVTDRGYSVKEVSARLGVSTKSLYDWIRLYQKPESVRLKETDQVRENHRLKAELARVTEERDILKRPPRTSQEMPSEVRVHQGAQVIIFSPVHVSCAESSSQRFLCVA